MGRCCSYAIFIKLIGLLSSVLAVLVLGVCAWVLVSTFRSTVEDFREPGVGQTSQNETTDASETVAEAFAIFENASSTSTSDNEISTVIGDGDLSIEDKIGTASFDITQIFRMWETASPKFKSIIQFCTAVAIAISATQFIVSMLTLCSRKKRLRGKAKFWQLVHFVIILLLLMCILVPLSYNRDKDKFRGAFTFGKYIKNQITSLIRNQHGPDLEPMSVAQFFLADLNAYYIALSLNIIVLLNFLLVSCCCIQCRAKNYYQSV